MLNVHAFVRAREGGILLPPTRLVGGVSESSVADAADAVLGSVAVGGVSLTRLGWRYASQGGRRAVGLCNASTRTLGLARAWLGQLETLPASDAVLDVVEDVLRHEVAHALDLERRGRTDHGPVWRRRAVAMGAVPSGTVQLPAELLPPPTVLGVCSRCDAVVRRLYRMPPKRVRRGYACGQCVRRGVPLRACRLTYRRVT